MLNRISLENDEINFMSKKNHGMLKILIIICGLLQFQNCLKL